MSQIISIHSFRGGTGKSNLTANLAALISDQGKRVGVIDTDIQSPGIHILFGLDEEHIRYSLNDYLWGKCDVQQAAYDVTPAGVAGIIHLIPSSIKAGEIARVLREGYDVGLLNDGFRDLIGTFQLDALMIDTHPGMNEETLLSIAVSDKLLVILRPDQQDYMGTGVTVEVARKLEVPYLQLIVNKTPISFDVDEVKRQVEETYHCPVAAIIPHSDEMMTLASAGLFALSYPDHPITETLRQVAHRLTG